MQERVTKYLYLRMRVMILVMIMHTLGFGAILARTYIEKKYIITLK